MKFKLLDTVEQTWKYVTEDADGNPDVTQDWQIFHKGLELDTATAEKAGIKDFDRRMKKLVDMNMAEIVK